MSEEALDSNASLIWSVAELLRGDSRQADYQKVALRVVVVRRLDCVREPAKDIVLDRYVEVEDRVDNLEPVPSALAGEQFYRTSPRTVSWDFGVSLG